MKKTVVTITLAIGSLGVFSQNYSDGLYLVNEGNFGSYDGDISFYDNESQTLYEDVFQTENPDEDGFDVLQDFEIFNDKAYLLSKGASDNKIAIVDAYDFTLLTSIDLASAGPQSITMISESKAYVSCANAPNLRILDIEGELMNGSVGSSIGSFSSQDNIALYGNSAFIFMGNKLGVIDTDLDSAYADIALLDAEPSCSGMIVSGDKLFVLTNSGWSGTASRLYRIDLLTNEVELNLDLSILGKARLLQSDASNLYFMIGNEVYQMEMDSEIAPDSSFATSSYEDDWDLAYGKSFYVNANSNQIYIGSAEGYVSDGSYEVLDLNDGTLISSGNASGGVGLNQFSGSGTVLGFLKTPAIAFSVYPNPAKDFIQIDLQEEGALDYHIINVEGKRVMQGNLQAATQRVDIGDLEKGIYVLSIYNAKSHSNKKVIVQ